MSLTVRNAIFENGPEGRGLRLTLLAIAKHLNEKNPAGPAWMLQKTLAKEATCSESQVKKDVAALKAGGWFAKVERRGRLNFYWLNLDRLGLTQQGQQTVPIDQQGQHTVPIATDPIGTTDDPIGTAHDPIGTTDDPDRDNTRSLEQEEQPIEQEENKGASGADVALSVSKVESSTSGPEGRDSSLDEFLAGIEEEQQAPAPEAREANRWFIRRVCNNGRAGITETWQEVPEGTPGAILRSVRVTDEAPEAPARSNRVSGIFGSGTLDQIIEKNSQVADAAKRQEADRVERLRRQEEHAASARAAELRARESGLNDQQAAALLDGVAV